MLIDITASMRPRQACLGMVCRLPHLRVHGGEASMRPRQACLGMAVEPMSFDLDECKLQ